LAPAIPSRRPSTANEQRRRWDRETKPCTLRPNTMTLSAMPSGRAVRAFRVASVAEAKHRSLPASLAGRTVRSASHAGDTRVLRCGFGRILGSGDRRTSRHLPPRHGTAPRASGPNGLRACRARPDAQTAGSCDGRSGRLNRRRSPGSATEWGFRVVSTWNARAGFGESRGRYEVEYQESEGGESALVLR